MTPTLVLSAEMRYTGILAHCLQVQQTGSGPWGITVLCGKCVSLREKKGTFLWFVLLITIISDSCVFQADAVLHFGTHGSLEFMPGKQVGMSDLCYPDSLISSIPNIYYYAANNPSEATIAKRRSYANTISYLTPPAENAGLYKGLKVSFLSVQTLNMCVYCLFLAN